MKVGLTGGIASGKTTTADYLRAWNVEISDSDELAHHAIMPGQPAYRDVVKHFGAAILNTDGTINRSRLGEIVFTDEKKREILNQIVHPRVRAQWKKELAEFESREDTKHRAPFIVAMIPLLYETGAEEGFDAVIVVGCRPEKQLERLRARGLNQDQCHARLHAQASIREKMQNADFVIWNEYSLAILEQQTRMVWQRLSTKHTS